MRASVTEWQAGVHDRAAGGQYGDEITNCGCRVAQQVFVNNDERWRRLARRAAGCDHVVVLEADS